MEASAPRRSFSSRTRSSCSVCSSDEKYLTTPRPAPFASYRARSAHGHADADLGLVDHIGLGDRLDDAIGKLFDLVARLSVAKHDREFVAAHAADIAVRADLVAQPFGDGLQDCVAFGVAEGVVDRFEAVQIEEHDCAGDIACRRLA